MSKQDKNVIIGLIIIAIGGILLLDTFEIINFNFWRMAGKFWPVILIVIGLMVILDRGKFKNSDKEYRARDIKSDDANSHESTAFGIFGDIRMAGFTGVPDSIDKSILIGDIVIDLSGARISEGECHISVSALIGDIDILLPGNVPVKADLNCLLGSTMVDRRKSDGLAANINHEDDRYTEASARIYIHGRALIGDISVMHAAG